MPLGIVEFRDVEEPDGRGRNRTVKKPFIAGTNFEVFEHCLHPSGWGAVVLADVDKELDIEYEVADDCAVRIRRYPAVPEAIRNLLSAHGCDHPGLALDKFIYRSAGQSFVKHALQTVVAVNAARTAWTDWFQRLQQRWVATMTAARAKIFAATTVGPLVLHLARASALENAGICLHPLYGFAYLPGSGLKGMAMAYAETVWLPGQTDLNQAWRQIEDVFGWAPNPDRKRQIHDRSHPADRRRANDSNPNSPEIKASVGKVVFHEAWPDAWPQLLVDIVNNHHPDYYQHDDNDHAPGDWENPVPVYFLAVASGTTFHFALAKRCADTADELLALAHQWLLGSLCHLGAGAKTNAGYGGFKPVDTGRTCAATTAAAVSWKAATSRANHRAEFSTTLELVTPGFLAGASQQAEDCDLRAATLRGQLRWWWRTMHAGFVDVKTLRALEGAIWGDTHGGGPLRVVLDRIVEISPRLYDKRSKAAFSEQQKVSELGIPNSDARKTTQGLWYASYGMDEGSQSNRRQRHVLEPRASWRLTLVAQPARYFTSRKDASDPKKVDQGRQITAEQILKQSQAALWLLCQFGGVGSKAGKGFGSLCSGDGLAWTLDSVKGVAAALRQELSLNNTFRDSAARSASLEQMLGPVEANFTWPQVWSVLDQVGFAYQTFAKKYKHRRDKMALGLPRRVGRPAQGDFHPAPPVTTNSRHTSPVRIHIAPTENGWVVRTIALPAAQLPNLAASRKFLQEFLKDFGEEINRRAVLQPPSPPPPHLGGQPQQPLPAGAANRGAGLPGSGQRVEAELLEQRSKGGGWRAKHVASGIAGPIQNSGDVPGDKKAGDRLPLIVQSANPKEIAFKYPTEAILKQLENTKSKQRGKGPGRGRGGR